MYKLRSWALLSALVCFSHLGLLLWSRCKDESGRMSNLLVGQHSGLLETMNSPSLVGDRHRVSNTSGRLHPVTWSPPVTWLLPLSSKAKTYSGPRESQFHHQLLESFLYFIASDLFRHKMLQCCRNEIHGHLEWFCGWKLGAVGLGCVLVEGARWPADSAACLSQAPAWVLRAGAPPPQLPAAPSSPFSTSCQRAIVKKCNIQFTILAIFKCTVQ